MAQREAGDLNQQVRALERARSELARVHRIIGSAGDYLDRGRPSPEERSRIEATTRRHQEEALALEANLNQLLAAARQSSPAALERWVNLHLAVLHEIAQGEIGEEQPSRNERTRLYIARQTRARWEEVLAGQRNYVPINSYFLHDYDGRLRARMGELDERAQPAGRQLGPRERR